MAEEKVKISELDEASTIQDGCCIPLVQDGTTKKIYYSTLLAKILDAIEEEAEIDWDNVTNKPSSFTPSEHNHDSRYYTETEIDALLASYVLSNKITHETWTFTLEDESTVNKEVVLWTSAT